MICKLIFFKAEFKGGLHGNQFYIFKGLGTLQFCHLFFASNL